MGEPETNNALLSPSPSQPAPPSQLQPKTPEIFARYASNPNIVKRMQGDTCFRCHQQGHWSWYCPLNSPNSNSKTLAPSPNHNNSPVSPNRIRCRCGHGFCEIKTAQNSGNGGKKYYVCPIKRGARCKEFIKWCDDPMDESDQQPPLFKYPECECGAGVCRREKEATESPNAVVKYYFACPVKQDHGSCGYRVPEDELLNNTSIVPIRQSRQRSLHEFWKGSQNDSTDNDLREGGDLLVNTKRMRIMDNSENHSSMAVSEILEGRDPGSIIKEANSQFVSFPGFKIADDDDIEFTNSVLWDSIEAEAFLSTRLSTPSRIRHRQCVFQRDIFAAADSFGPCNKLFSSMAKIDESMENSPTLEDHTKFLEEEKVRLTHIQDDCTKTEALFETYNQQRKLLREQVSHLMAMLHEKQNELESCELETMKIETQLGDQRRKMLEVDIIIKDRVGQVEEVRKKSVERHAKKIAAKTALQKAKLVMENKLLIIQ